MTKQKTRRYDSVGLKAANHSSAELTERLDSGLRRNGVTAETALLLAKVLGTTAEFWLNLQLVNDLWLAEHNEVLAEKLKRARPLAACLE